MGLETIALITAIGGLASAGAGVASAFSRPRTPQTPAATTPPQVGTPTDPSRVNSPAARLNLISTTPQGILGSSPVTRGRLLGG